jgi:hypothetical protein
LRVNLTTELSLGVCALATLNPAAMTNAANIASFVIATSLQQVP